MTIAVIGDAFVDIIVSTQDIRTGGTYQRAIKVSSGGTANVAVWLSRLGKEAKFVGAAGDDLFGEFFKRDLDKERVSHLLAIDSEHSTGVCTSLVGERGERTMITYRGANDYLSKEHIDAHLEQILDLDVLYFTGYSFISDVTRDSIEHLLKQCKEYECEVWLNPGASNILNNIHIDIIKEYVDVLLLNIEEAKELTGQSDAHAIINHLGHLSNFIIMTMGADGCLLSNNGEVIHTSALNVANVVDTTGAGDAFAAGFIAGYLDTQTMEECSKLGHETAAKVITKLGAR
jgi:sugar/nucleoside kinase (ribokinase family)